MSLARSGVKIGILHVNMDSIKKFRRNSKGFFYNKDNEICQYSFYGINLPLLTGVNTLLVKGIARLLFRWYSRRFGMPDLIHAHSIYKGGLVARDLSDRYGIPFVITEHYSGYTRTVFSERIKKKMEKCISTCSCCMSVSENFAGFLNLFFLKAGKKWVYVPNMVSSMFFNHPVRETRSDTFFFLCIASLTTNKAVDVLIRSFSSAFSPDERVKLLIAGEGPEKAKLKKLAVDRRVSSKVEFLGRLSREQVVEVFGSVDALVVSSKYETFGVVVAEALAMGVPVVATRCGGPESILSNGDGLLVDNGDESKLADALKEMYCNRAEYRPAEIRKRCAARFSEDVVVEKIKNVYLSILDLNHRHTTM